MLAVDKSKVFTQKNIIKVFKMLDKNGDGTIDVNEFKAIIPKEVTDKKVGKE
jgi:Ca2+-binding EF-hand superfamily protein